LATALPKYLAFAEALRGGLKTLGRNLAPKDPQL